MTKSLGLSVLVIDDEVAIRHVFCHFLEGQGHKVVTVGTGAEAKKSVQSVEFDVIILDKVLPDISGLDLVSELVAHAPNTKIILLTGSLSEETEIRAANVGIFRCLQKPIRATALIEVVESAAAASSPPGKE